MRDDQALNRLFAAARTVEGASTPERERARARVAARLVASGSVAATTALVGTTATAGTTGLGATVGVASTTALGGTAAVVLKVFGVSLAVGVVTGGAWLVTRRPADHHTIAQADVRPVASLERPEQRAVGQRSSADARVRSDGRAARPAASSPAAGSVVIVQHGESAPPASSSQISDTLASEIVLVRDAQRALDSGSPSRALALLDQYFRRYPHGVLVPEARATRVKALCVAGRGREADAESASLARTHPESPLVGRARGGCVPR